MINSDTEKNIPKDANEHCPGVEDENAGKSSACAGCPNQQACQDAPKGPDPDVDEIRQRMSSIKHKILVLSGKGGVGKSTFSAQLGFALSEDTDIEVGMLDIDICGPSLPKIFGLENEQIHKSNLGWQPAYVEDNLGLMSVGFMLNNPNEAIIWRGPKKNGLIKQFLKEVYWGTDLDYLVIDTPPGTSDEHLSITQYLGCTNVDGAVIITGPQEVSLVDVRKEINFCKKIGVPIIGVVENMSGFICPKCKTESQIFIPTTGGAEQMAIDMQVPFLGKIPLDPLIAKSCDEGLSYVADFPDSEATKKFKIVFENIKQKIKETQTK